MQTSETLTASPLLPCEPAGPGGPGAPYIQRKKKIVWRFSHTISATSSNWLIPTRSHVVRFANNLTSQGSRDGGFGRALRDKYFGQNSANF